MATLRNQFGHALTNIEVNGNKRRRTINAHTEIQEVLASDDQLSEWGVNSRLIGSYPRHTGIYPGKDVDVFVRFEDLDTAASPQSVYGRVEAVLVHAYGAADDGGRATPQARSVKVDIPDTGSHGGNVAFAVDAVPAVRDGEQWAIPTKDRKDWAESRRRWVSTNPERFGDLSSALSTSQQSPTVGGQNAYKPIVKLMRQARSVHLGDRRPGGLYVEFAIYAVWHAGLVVGNEWDALLAATLRRVGERFDTVPSVPLLDPGLGTAVEPALVDADWLHARDTFLSLADLADEALGAGNCKAAVNWRRILGQNDRGQIVPLPPGCDANGFPISAAPRPPAPGRERHAVSGERTTAGRRLRPGLTRSLHVRTRRPWVRAATRHGRSVLAGPGTVGLLALDQSNRHAHLHPRRVADDLPSVVRGRLAHQPPHRRRLRLPLARRRRLACLDQRRRPLQANR